MNISVLDFFKFASRMPQIAQIFVSAFKIFQGSMPPDPPRNFLFFLHEQFQAQFFTFPVPCLFFTFPPSHVCFSLFPRPMSVFHFSPVPCLFFTFPPSHVCFSLFPRPMSVFHFSPVPCLRRKPSIFNSTAHLTLCLPSSPYCLWSDIHTCHSASTCMTSEAKTHSYKDTLLHTD